MKAIEQMNDKEYEHAYKLAKMKSPRLRTADDYAIIQSFETKDSSL